MINVGVFGYGTVGSGVVEVITKNAAVIKKNVGEEVRVKAILDLRDFPGDEHEDKIVHDVNDVVNDPEIKIICETMGGVGAAYKFTKDALSKGISVCTSNKELVALHGPELIALAKANNCSYKFEASVGGGIPIIRPLQDAITADRILSVKGIVNGTTNYMLTKMTNEGADFDKVLKEAQANGYAEANPAADIEGHDAARKIAILSSLLYGKTVKSEDIHTEGIVNISADDIKYASKLNYRIKLIAKYVDDEEAGAYALVAPHLVPASNPLYNVSDVFNGILVTGNMLDEAMFYGRGAGKLPTASAVVGDVVECAKTLGTHVACNWIDEDVLLPGLELSKKAWFVRVDESAKEQALKAFGAVNEVEALQGEYAFVTSALSEADFNKKSEGLKLINRIRVEE